MKRAASIWALALGLHAGFAWAEVKRNEASSEWKFIVCTAEEYFGGEPVPGVTDGPETYRFNRTQVQGWGGSKWGSPCNDVDQSPSSGLSAVLTCSIGSRFIESELTMEGGGIKTVGERVIDRSTGLYTYLFTVFAGNGDVSFSGHRGRCEATEDPSAVNKENKF